ncbi:unnamed protein product [Nyctereutes procyonoides]|uniref:(raccoon dog) hypothetical protein n=1 Tax=Nyctereutes procyonoides TaxID=34880 RepID=A0A811ZSW0_NYCPR|nr:unnamed protein product [Nyctereutes procyonoides]
MDQINVPKKWSHIPCPWFGRLDVVRIKKKKKTLGPILNLSWKRRVRSQNGGPRSKGTRAVEKTVYWWFEL